jgi:hypothetical protein
MADDENGLDAATFPIFGLFTFILFMTPVFKWIYVRAPPHSTSHAYHPISLNLTCRVCQVNVMREYERFINAANLAEDDEDDYRDTGGA